MALPKAIDFAGLSKEHVFNSDSKQYKILNTIPDDKWVVYCNKMLGKGVSVTYDAEMDQFTAKPQKLKVKESLSPKEKESLMKSKKQINELYNDNYFENLEPDFDVQDLKQVKELCFLLSKDGIDKDDYPRWVIKELEQNGLIEEDDEYVYYFSAEGKQVVGAPIKMQKFLLQNDGISSKNDSESPYLRGREEQTESKQMNKFFEGDKVRFNLTEGEIVSGTIKWINDEDNSCDITLPDGSTLTVNESDMKKSQKLYEANYKFKHELNEDEKRALLYDQDEEDDENLPEETSTEEDEIDLKVDDEEEPNFDDEISSLADGVDDDESDEEIVDDDPESELPQQGGSQQMVNVNDLESVLRKILGNVTSATNDKGVENDQYPNGEAKEVQENVPSLGQGPQQNVLQTEFAKDTNLTQTDTLDTDVLKAVYGHEDGEILDKEFQEINDNVSNVQDKIGQPSYQDYLTGESEETPDLYNYKNDGYGEDEEYLTDDADFERNSVLSGGLGAYDTSEETGDMFEEDDVDELPSVSGNLDVETTASPVQSVPTGGVDQIQQPVNVNKTIQCCGIPIQIVLSGVMLTMQDVSSIVEGVSNKGLKVSRIESHKRDELNIIIESNGRKYSIQYKDVPAARNQLPFSIKHERFNSLSEACNRIRFVSKQRLTEKDNFTKFNDKDLLQRKMNDPKDSTILTEVKSNENFVSAWNVKSVGSVNLKSGLNEVFSNLIGHSKEKNTLIKTRDGQFYLIKGNLKERSEIGTTKELVDAKGKKSYGVGRVIGVYENSVKGLGRIMYHTKRTSLPLLIWK